MSASAIQTSAAPIRVLHVTDPHLFADPEGRLRGTVTLRTFEATLAHAAEADWRPDLIALTGDLIQDDSREAYTHFPPLLEPFGVPVLCLPGNHDVRSLMREMLADPPFHYCGTFHLGDWVITGIDSCLEGSAGGLIAGEELDRLERVVQGCEAAHALVCLHHPPLPVGSAWLDSVGLGNGEELLARLEALGTVRGALFGHVHQVVDTTAGGIRLIATPSTCRQFKPASDSFDVDDRPPAYRHIELHSDGRIGSELVWLNDATNHE